MSLRTKIENNTAVVGVIGLGYVGLPLLRAFWAAGFPVVGFDVDPRKIDAIDDHGDAASGWQRCSTSPVAIERSSRTAG